FMRSMSNHASQSATCRTITSSQATPACTRSSTPPFISTDTTATGIYTLSLHDALPIWIKFMKDGVNATPLPTVNTTGYIDHAAFLGTINPDTNKIPKHLFQGYLNIYNNYFKAPWMPDRTEANPNELNQDDA